MTLKIHTRKRHTSWMQHIHKFLSAMHMECGGEVVFVTAYLDISFIEFLTLKPTSFI